MKPPQVLNLEGNLAENWRKWEQPFNLYLVASGIGDKTAKFKRPHYFMSSGRTLWIFTTPLLGMLKAMK